MRPVEHSSFPMREIEVILVMGKVYIQTKLDDFLSMEYELK